MLTISRTQIPEECLLNHTGRPLAQSMERPPMEHVPSKSQQVPVVPRSFGSTSSADSDLFSDILPWEALFESNIWDPSITSGPQSVPSDISRAYSGVDDMTDISRILDPTSIEFGFQYSYLSGIDDKLLYSPLEAFASICWESAIPGSHQDGQDSMASHSDLTSILDLDEEPPSPTFTDRVHHIPVPISASLLWSDDSDSDSDDCRTYHDDYTPISNIHDNGAIRASHSVGEFLPIEKEKSLFYRDLTTTLGTFEPIFLLSDQKESIGQSPTPIIPAQNKSVPKRIAEFCHSRLPSRSAATTVR